MSSHEENAAIENLGAIMAELKADAKALSEDLVKGINAFREVSRMLLALAILSLAATIPVAFPQFYVGIFGTLLVGALILLSGLSAVVSFIVWGRYSALRKKYSSLLAIWKELNP